MIKQTARFLLRRFPRLMKHPKMTAYEMLMLNEDSYLYDSGWIESLKRGYPCDKNGEPLPWMNFPIIAFLEERLSKEHTLFEYGSGYSTMFYASHVQHVTSVEYDQAWLEIIQHKAPANVTLIFQEQDINGDYCRTIARASQNYDVIIVDGRDRVNCIKQSLDYLSDEGVILLDDAHREQYQEGIDFVRSRGFKALEFEGLKPASVVKDKTTVFYRHDNCLKI